MIGGNMTLCEAMKEIEKRPMTAWMAWGILKSGNEYVIVGTQHLKKFPDADYLYKRVGEAFPLSPIMNGSRNFEKVSK